jgi:hypothetical protein
VDTYRGGASSGQGQTTALVSEMLTGAGQQQDAGDVSSMLPQWLEEIWPQGEENNVALALRHAREVQGGRPDSSVRPAQQNVQLVQQHVQINVQNPLVPNGLDGERLQLEMVANQLQQYRDGLDLAARQYTENMQNSMREVENMEFVNQQEATQQMRLFGPQQYFRK